MIDPHEIIETLEYAKRVIGDENEVLMKPIDKSIKELRQALAQPEERGHCTCGDPTLLGYVHFRTRPCIYYTAPPKREWVGLTVEEARKFYEKYTDREELIYAIDKFLEEKNT